jgi:hypothetical protein
MRRRLVILGVVGFWLVMMGTLVRRWIHERRLGRAPGTYRSTLTRERRNYQERMGIYWRGRRVGHTQTLFFYREDGRHSIQNATRLTEGVPGFPRESAFELHTTLLVGVDLSLERLSMSLEVNGQEAARCDGTVEDGKLTLRPTLNGERQEPMELEIPPGAMVSQALSPLLALPPLRTGMRWSVTVVDPFTLAPSQAEVRVLRREDLQWQGQTVGTHVVEVQSGMWMRALAWVSREGEVLKQQTVLGLTFIREPIPEEERPEAD